MTFGRTSQFLRIVAAGLAFGIAYTQASLYYSNQNQYFLHGLAVAGVGELEHDWLANTADPTPLFSGLIAATARCFGAGAFYGIHLLLLSVYALSMLAIASRVSERLDDRRTQFLFLAILTVVHSALARWGSYRILGWDYPWYFQAGLAGQYVLGGMLQPSVFGELLLASIAAYLWDRPTWGVVFAVAAGVMHSTYLLAAGMLTLVYVTDLARSGKARAAVALGATAFLLVLPSIIYAATNFAPSSPEAFSESQRILARIRIPHHCLPRLWLDGVALCQIGWMLLGIALSRGTKLYLLQITVFALSAMLTLAQVATDSDTIALLFPWRTSAILVPLSTTIVLARLIHAAPSLSCRPWVTAAAAVMLATAVAAGGLIMWHREGYRSNDAELPLYAFATANRQAGDTYLLPARTPNLAANTKGSLSSDFKPLAERSKDVRIVPIDFQRFRLHTGVPIFVDFKSIPYKDVEVLEWQRRMQWNEKIYKDGFPDRDETYAELKQNRITHIVTTRSQTMGATGFAIVYEDANYRVYQRSQ